MKAAISARQPLTEIVGLAVEQLHAGTDDEGPRYMVTLAALSSARRQFTYNQQKQESHGWLTQPSITF